MALADVLAVLLSITLYLSAVSPTARTSIVAIAGPFPAEAVVSAGLKAGFLCYGAAGLLGLLPVPDKANALLYLLFLSLQPTLKSLLERIPARSLEWLCKLAVFSAVLNLFWSSLHNLFLSFLPETLQVPWMVYATGDTAFVIYDVGFSKLVSLYMTRVDGVLRKTSQSSIIFEQPQNKRQMEQGEPTLVRDMMGYGRGKAMARDRSIAVELRSVDNRCLDCTIKLPRIYVFVEDATKSKVQVRISRGKVDVFVTISPSENGDVPISVNKPVAGSYYAALCVLWGNYGLRDDISVSLPSRFQDVFLVKKTQEDLEAMSADIYSVLGLVLQDFGAMQAREGGKLSQDVTGRARTIEALATRVKERAPGVVADHRARLSARMAGVFRNTQLDESRILIETAVYADRVAVDKRTAHLRNHPSQLDHMLAQEGPVGHKLGFPIQKFNWETNTIDSECNDIEAAGYMVDIKAEVEKIREQTQNIEQSDGAE